SYRLWLIYALRLMRYDNSPQLKSPELQPEERAVAAEMKEAVERVLTAEAELIEARSEFEKQFAAATRVVSHAIRAVAEDGRFREAIAWQTRRLLRAGIASLLRHETNGSRDSKQRKNEEAVASYW